MSTSNPKRCAACGEPAVPGAAFCRACGARHGRVCEQCGAPLAQGAAFCRSCGTRLAGAGEKPEGMSNQPTARRQPPPPSMPPPQVRAQGERSWRSPLLIAAAILLLGAGAAAAIFFVGKKGSSAPVASTVLSGKPAGEEEVAGEEAVEAEPAETDSNGLPPVGRAELGEEIGILLREYHEDVVDHDFQLAWGLLSARKRRQDLAEYGYGKWKQAQASLSDYLSPGGLEAHFDGAEGEGVARVDVTGMGWSAPGSTCSEWSGLTWARYEEGAWTYDPGYSTTAPRRRRWRPREGELLGGDC